MAESTTSEDAPTTSPTADETLSAARVASDQADGGPGPHTEDGTGGVANDPASGGISEAAGDPEDAAE